MRLIKRLWPVFAAVFLAELGDKTQVAVILFVAGGVAGPLETGLAAGLALLASTALAVLGGAALGRLVPPALLKIFSGLIFIALGGVYVAQALG